MKANAHSLHLDGKVLARFLFSLNVIRHHSEIYPGGHPLVTRSLQQALNLLEQLLEFEDRLCLGVARDTLLVGPDILDRRNAIYRDLAGALFSCDIASITFHRSLPERELWHFLQGLRLKREGLQAHGGICSWLADEGVGRLEVCPIDYLAFRTTEEESLQVSEGEETVSDGLWISLVEGLMTGTLDTRGDSLSRDDADPELLARLLNQRIGSDFPQEHGSGEEQYDRAITSFLQQIDREGIDNRLRREPLEKLNAFFGRLAPEVRRKFLSSTFRFLDGRRDLAKEVLGSFSGDIVLQSLEEIEDETISVPPLVIELLGQFSAHGDSPVQRRVVASRDMAEDELKRRIKTLFRQDSSERFVSGDYQLFLQQLQLARPTGELEASWVEGMVRNLESHALEKQICSVILQIGEELPDGGSEELQDNLADLIAFFLGRGDMAALIETHDRLTAQAAGKGDDVSLARKGLALFNRPDFIAGIWEGLETWGRSRLPEIQALVATVGAPFAEPLLARLSEEPGMSMRRFYMDCLVRLREAALAPIYARLGDRRWYFVRNLVIVLRRLEDPRVLDPLGRLIAYPHAKVQIEVMKTFHQFLDPRGDRHLLLELSHVDTERRGRAVQAARWSFSPEVFTRLAEMLHSDFSQEEYPVKSALVQTLAEIGKIETVDALARFLDLRTLRHRLPVRRLKAEAIRALGKHPSDPGHKLLGRLASTSGGEIGALAAAALRISRGGTP